MTLARGPLETGITDAPTAAPIVRCRRPRSSASTVWQNARQE